MSELIIDVVADYEWSMFEGYPATYCDTKEELTAFVDNIIEQIVDYERDYVEQIAVNAIKLRNLLEGNPPPRGG
jgi:hypothetical protein